MKKVLSIILSSFALVSCVDTVLLPDDKTVEEDFWQTKEDVQAMVSGAYSALAQTAVQQRLVVWTSRSDELNVNTSLNNSALNQINSASIQTTNNYCSWGEIYSVINKCNLVLSKSEEVMDIDPNYLEGDHHNNIAQMKALRSLCYFYLIRVFRDVPLILEPYKESSQEMNIPQSAPSVVLDQIIADLEEVKNNALLTQSVSDDAKRCGYFTKDGIYALLADVYLWKASIYGDEKCYKKCIECCNVIRNNRNNNSGGQNDSATSFDDDGFNLNPFYRYFDIFVEGGNNQESLFELQFDNNEGLCNVYNRTSNKNTLPMYYTNQCYAKTEGDIFDLPDHKKDVRGFTSVYDFNKAGEEAISIRKFVEEKNPITVSNEGQELTAPPAVSSAVVREYSNYRQNWIFYRVTDVMLMKAEALVQLGSLLVNANLHLTTDLAAATTSEDSLRIATQMQEINSEVSQQNVTAARQVQIVSARARTDQASQVDSTSYKLTDVAYNGNNLQAYATAQNRNFSGLAATLQSLETLVMNERARELCFEGKRWFDLLRYNYRHTTGVNYDVILGLQAGNNAVNYADMLNLVARKYTASGGGAGIVAKMPTEPYLYLPILHKECALNPALIQNPVYTDGGTTEKQY